MARKIRFPLEMEGGIKVRNMDELKTHFSIEKVTEYYLEGKLKTWLQDRYYMEELSRIEELKNLKDKNEIPGRLAAIFHIEQSHDFDVAELEEKTAKISILRSFSDEEEWESKLAHTAFTQEELGNILREYERMTSEEEVKKVYLCGETFVISDAVPNILYQGVNRPLVQIRADKRFDAEKKNIQFENLRLTSSKKVELRMKDSPSCEVDADTIQLQKDICFRTTVIEKFSSNTTLIADSQGKIHAFGLCSHGENYIPKIEAPIIDLISPGYYVLALDSQGKVYQWGSLPYKCSPVPKDLPKIKQIAGGSKIMIALDESGRLHWWGGWDIEKIFRGKSYYHDPMAYKAMPEIREAIVQVECSGEVVMALDSKGKIHTWGAYSENRWGKPSAPIHILPENLPFIRKIAVFDGGSYAFALDDKGKLHFWGKNVDGSGDLPENLPPIIDISSGNASYYYSALDENGKLHFWGRSKRIVESSMGINCEMDFEEDWKPVKEMPRLRYAAGLWGIDEEGYIYGSDGHGPLFEGIKAMIPK